MLKLDFTYADLNLPATLSVTRRQSISGVQQKTQLLRQRGRFVPVESGGDYILKPAPRNTPARLAADIPANEALTMDIAHDIFKINVAEHELAQLADGELAYLTKRFDSRSGVKLHQEDFCQLSNRSPADFVELGLCYDIGEYDVRELLSSFIQNQHQVTDTIESSYLSPEAKELYLSKFLDRLRAIKQ